MPFAASRMDLEIVILREKVRQRQISCDSAYMWNLKKKRKQSDLQNRNKLQMYKQNHGYW